MDFSRVAAAAARLAREAMRHLGPIVKEAWRVLQPVVADFVQEVTRWWITKRKEGEAFSSQRPKGPGMQRPTPATDPVQEYRFTFGMKYSREEHPAFPAAHPDGWLTILARSEEQARAVAWAVIGAAWAFCYAEPFDEAKWAQDHPLGELARIDASLTPSLSGEMAMATRRPNPWDDKP